MFREQKDSTGGKTFALHVSGIEYNHPSQNGQSTAGYDTRTHACTHTHTGTQAQKSRIKQYR